MFRPYDPNVHPELKQLCDRQDARVESDYITVENGPESDLYDALMLVAALIKVKNDPLTQKRFGLEP